MSSPLPLGRGHVDALVPSGAGSAISGYYQLLQGGGPLGFTAFVGDGQVSVSRADLAQPSADIAALPHCAVLPMADRCRFRLELDVPFESVRPHTVVTLRPETDQGPALGLRHLHAPTTRRPDANAIASVGGGYEAVAQEFLSYLVDVAGVTPASHVLEVGCGIGRMALGLSAYLTTGTYTGLDVMAGAIDTARATFAGHAAEPRLRFEHLDVYNGWYNPGGRLQTRDVHLAEHVDRAPDVILMSSLLTHLFPEDAAHYLAEARRVLAPGGRVLATAWLMDERTKALTRAGRAAIPFQERDGYWVESVTNPEGALALEADFVQRAVGAAGLEEICVVPGFWSGEVGLAFQDMLLLRNASPSM
jgi:SAM-dependent methyltransferase